MQNGFTLIAALPMNSPSPSAGGTRGMIYRKSGDARIVTLGGEKRKGKSILVAVDLPVHCRGAIFCEFGDTTQTNTRARRCTGDRELGRGNYVSSSAYTSALPGLGDGTTDRGCVNIVAYVNAGNGVGSCSLTMRFRYPDI